MLNNSVGILMHGKFVTVGTLYELRVKYAEYIVCIRKSEDGLSRKELMQLLQNFFPELIEHRNSTMADVASKKDVTFRVKIIIKDNTYVYC